MADFCSLCGYNDINITDLYNRIIKPDVEKEVSEMSEDEFISVNVGGVCEHCGITSFGVNNKLEVWSRLYGEDELHHFANINPDSFDIEIIEDDPMYMDQRISVLKEVELLSIEFENIWKMAYELYTTGMKSKWIECLSLDEFKKSDDSNLYFTTAFGIHYTNNQNKENETGEN